MPSKAYPKLNYESKGKPDNKAIESRFKTFLGGRYAKYNLSSVIYAGKQEDGIEAVVWDAPGRSKPTFEEAKKEIDAGNTEKIGVGHRFGPSWTQHWVKVTIDIPSEWKKHDHVELIFDPSCEGMVFDQQGVAIQGITGGFDYNRRVEYIIPHKEVEAGKCVRYIEVSANGMFGAGPQDDVRDDKYYTLETLAIGAVNIEARRLSWDFELLSTLPDVLPEQSPLGNKARAVANKIMNTFDGSLASVTECRKLAEDVMGKGWQEAANKQVAQDEGTLWALGYCHIDTAWLWPWSATQQKVARTWSSQIDIADRYPEFRFFASAAQHYRWLEEYYPAVFDKVKQKIKDKQFDVNGGCWVEMDGNIPSGESLARQFVHGQKYFMSRFGIKSDVLVLPDTFGFGPQIPQIARLSGCPNFFTHKLNWNEQNDFPLTTFNWVGLDGSQVLSHITPIQRYDSDCTLLEIMRGYQHHKNLDITNESLIMFGNGDGGGGPSAQMLERLRRTRAAGLHSDRSGEQLPLVKTGFTLSEFFEHTRKKTHNGKVLPDWNGEMYLEKHRGVQTTQSRTKRNFRISEHLIREAEYVSTLASVQAGYSYPKKQFDHLWESLCLCMFHDTLPGSSIHIAVEDYDRKFAEIHKTARELFDHAIKAIESKSSSAGCAVVNTLPSHARREVVSCGEGKKCVAAVDAESIFGHQEHGLRSSEGVTVYKKDDSVKLSNSSLDVIITRGRIASVFDKNEKRELLPEGKTAGFMIFRDMPHDGDAWEITSYTLESGAERLEAECHVVENGPLRGAVECVLKTGQSEAKITISLDAVPASLHKDSRSLLRFDCHVDWHERHRLLKFELPLDIWSQEATYDVAWGVIKRPTHRNTSWDNAKFEVPAHKFADYSEYGYGVALLNNCKYGYSTQGNVMTLSLLRSPTEPDPEADQGKHEFSFAIYPHLGTYETSDVQQVAHAFNTPLKVLAKPIADEFKHAPFTIEGTPNVMLETIKRGEGDFDEENNFAESDSKGKTVILRLHENMGGRGLVKLSSRIGVKKAALVNILEEHMEELDVVTDTENDTIDLKFRAFEIKTVQLTL